MPESIIFHGSSDGNRQSKNPQAPSPARCTSTYFTQINIQHWLMSPSLHVLVPTGTLIREGKRSVFSIGQAGSAIRARKHAGSTLETRSGLPLAHTLAWSGQQVIMTYFVVDISFTDWNQAVTDEEYNNRAKQAVISEIIGVAFMFELDVTMPKYLSQYICGSLIPQLIVINCFTHQGSICYQTLGTASKHVRELHGNY